MERCTKADSCQTCVTMIELCESMVICCIRQNGVSRAVSAMTMVERVTEGLLQTRRSKRATEVSVFSCCA